MMRDTLCPEYKISAVDVEPLGGKAVQAVVERETTRVMGLMGSDRADPSASVRSLSSPLPVPQPGHVEAVEAGFRRTDGLFAALFELGVRREKPFHLALVFAGEDGAGCVDHFPARSQQGSVALQEFALESAGAVEAFRGDAPLEIRLTAQSAQP